MKCASLFSGEGGFDLAADWMGWETVLQCELNPFSQKILQYYWPLADLYSDITKTDFTKYEGLIDVLTGGFPCQPYSVAGKRQGTADARHLWPEMLRAIREIKPRWVVGENVRGLINWSGGLVFDEVQTDLELEGYSILPFILPACGVNAPHRRERVWFVAHRSDTATDSESIRDRGAVQRLAVEDVAIGQSEKRREGNTKLRHAGNFGYATDAESGRRGGVRNGSSEERAHGSAATQPTSGSGILDAADTYSERFQERDIPGVSAHTKRFAGRADAFGRDYWLDFPTQPPVCGRDDGLSYGLDATAVFGKPTKPNAARTFSKWRNESIKAHGNAIVPQVVLQIYDAIEMYDLLHN